MTTFEELPLYIRVPERAFQHQVRVTCQSTVVQRKLERRYGYLDSGMLWTWRRGLIGRAADHLGLDVPEDGEWMRDADGHGPSLSFAQQTTVAPDKPFVTEAHRGPKHYPHSSPKAGALGGLARLALHLQVVLITQGHAREEAAKMRVLAAEIGAAMRPGQCVAIWMTYTKTILNAATSALVRFHLEEDPQWTLGATREEALRKLWARKSMPSIGPLPPYYKRQRDWRFRILQIFPASQLACDRVPAERKGQSWSEFWRQLEALNTPEGVMWLQGRLLR